MLIVANWKAYIEDLTRAKSLLTLSKRLLRERTLTIVLAPPAPLLGALAATHGSEVALAAQDVSATTGGAKTGENTAQTFAALGATYTIIGHSERRAVGDTNAVVAEKMSHALAHGLIPILCIGEGERDKAGEYLALIREEITTALVGLTPKERRSVIVAYEPLWAIGKGSTFAISPNDLSEMVLYIRKVLGEFLPGDSAHSATILYGGSVAVDNARALAASTGINGFLVGHASVDGEQFSQLVTALD